MRAKLIVLFLLFLLAFVQVSPGFFPDMAEVDARWHKNLRGLNSFQVEFLFDLDEKLSVRHWQKQDLWREEWTVQIDGQNRVIWAGLGRGEEVILSYPRLRVKPVPVLCIWQKSLDWWIAKGLNTNFLSYQFLQDTPCLVIGSSSGNEPLQLWLDNNLMLPVRMIPGSGGQEFSLTWLNYYQIGNFWLPGKLSIAYQDKNWECSIEWKGINIDLPDGLFSQQDFKNRFETLNQAVPSEVLMLMQVLARAHETI